MEHLRFESSVTRSDGWYVDFGAGCAQSSISDCDMYSAIGGIRTVGAATVTIERCRIYNSIAVTGIGIRVDGGPDISIRDVVMDANAQIFAGIYITNSGDVTIEDCNILTAGQALYINPGAGETVASIWANNSFFDHSDRGMYIQAAGGNVVRSVFNQCWFGSSVDQGVLMTTSGGGTIDGIYFNGCEFFLNGTGGLYVADTGTTNVHIKGGSAAQNIGNAIEFEADVHDFSVDGLRAGGGDGLTNNTLAGIVVGAGTGNNYTITNNILRNNTTAPLVDGGTGVGKVIHSNPDYDVGYATYDPGSLLDGDGVTTTVAVFGAAMGDFAEAAFSGALQGITVTAWVSAAGTVSVRFQNETGGTLDLASGTLRVRTSRFT